MIHSKFKADLFSYLRPIIAELEMLQERPLKVSLNRNFVDIANVTLMHCLGDGVQVTELMAFSGHMSTYGCRLCLTKAQRRPDLLAQSAPSDEAEDDSESALETELEESEDEEQQVVVQAPKPKRGRRGGLYFPDTGMPYRSKNSLLRKDKKDGDYVSIFY